MNLSQSLIDLHWSSRILTDCLWSYNLLILQINVVYKKQILCLNRFLKLLEIHYNCLQKTISITIFGDFISYLTQDLLHEALASKQILSFLGSQFKVFLTFLFTTWDLMFQSDLHTKTFQTKQECKWAHIWKVQRILVLLFRTLQNLPNQLSKN